jgi:hypothetical protein
MNSGQLQINELTTILNEHFHWNKARMNCFVGMLNGGKVGPMRTSLMPSENSANIIKIVCCSYQAILKETGSSDRWRFVR